MPAMEPLFNLVGIKPFNLSKKEIALLEADIFVLTCKQLMEVFRKQFKDYFHLMRFTTEMENTMLEKNFIKLIINDILSTEEYTLQGIAHYTGTHEDVVCDLASGLNTKPLAICLFKILELHQLVRRELYYAIGKKIVTEYVSAELTPDLK